MVDDRGSDTEQQAPRASSPPILYPDPSEQPGLEVIDGPAGREEKIVSNQNDHGLPEVLEPLAHPDDRPVPWQGQVKKRRCGMRRGVALALLIGIVLFAIGLGVGLGVGLQSSNGNEDSGEPTPSPTSASPDPDTSSANPVRRAEEYKIGGALDAGYYSSNGAWNGTGIANVWQRYDADSGNSSRRTVYYQDHAREIRWREYKSGEGWVAGSGNVTTTAKNGTPIAASTYVGTNAVQYVHVFYLDANNVIRDKIKGSAGTNWSDGAIGDANLTAYNGSMTGLTACGGAPGRPIRLFFAANSTTLEEHVYRSSNREWQYQRSFYNYSAAAGVDCHSMDRPWTYLAMVNLNNTLEIWYRNGSTFEPDGWFQTNVVENDLYAASGVTLTAELCAYQKRDSTFRVHVATLNAQGTSLDDGEAFSIDSINITLGTRLDSTSIKNSETGEFTGAEFYAQVEGEDITYFERSSTVRGRWKQHDILVEGARPSEIPDA